MLQAKKTKCFVSLFEWHNAYSSHGAIEAVAIGLTGNLHFFKNYSSAACHVTLTHDDCMLDYTMLASNTLNPKPKVFNTSKRVNKNWSHQKCNLGYQSESSSGKSWTDNHSHSRHPA